MTILFSILVNKCEHRRVLFQSLKYTRIYLSLANTRKVLLFTLVIIIFKNIQAFHT